MAKNSVNVNAPVEVPKKKAPFSVMIQQDGYKNLINNTLGDPKRAAGFITAITSAVATGMLIYQNKAAVLVSGAVRQGWVSSPMISDMDL